jgi:hypothetical protein
MHAQSNAQVLLSVLGFLLSRFLRFTRTGFEDSVLPGGCEPREFCVRLGDGRRWPVGVVWHRAGKSASSESLPPSHVKGRASASPCRFDRGVTASGSLPC